MSDTHRVVNAAGRQPQEGAEPCEVFRMEDLPAAEVDLKMPEVGPTNLGVKEAAYTAETGSYMYMCPEASRTVFVSEMTMLDKLQCMSANRSGPIVSFGHL